VNDRWPYPVSMTMQRQAGRGNKLARKDDKSPADAAAIDNNGESQPAESPLVPSACQTGLHPKE
jgi:hypothetical protein